MGLQSTFRRCRFLVKEIIFSDEANFDLCGYVNKQNCHIWGTENPHAYIEKPTLPKRVTVWCWFWSRGIIGPFIFENNQEETVMVIVIGPCWMNFCLQKLKRMILATFGFNRTRRAVPHSRRYIQCFVPYFWRSHYQPQLCGCRLATSELRFDTVGLLFVGYRQW